MSKPKIQISWSGGKDSALALHKILENDQFEVIGLHTVIDENEKRVGIHNIKQELIEKQAEQLNLPLTKLYLEKKPMAYEKLMEKYYRSLKDQDIDHVMFGDIFLEDLKDFRESILEKTEVKGVYPIWKRDTNLLVKEFIDLNFKTILCAVDSKFISKQWVGEVLSREFINNHPSIDPCGENGEYHSFVVDGPLFKNEINLTTKDKYEQDFTFNVKDKKGNDQVINDKFFYAEFELS